MLKLYKKQSFNLVTMFKKVILGLSGGVDSSVAAYLLKKEGYEVEAVFMKNWEGDDDDEHCSAETDLSDAQIVAQKLQIPLHTVNFAKEYWDKVFSHFLEEYKKGRTPNPDILCNKEIKFKAFYQHALTLGADYIATGHYAQTTEINGKTCLKKGLDNSKDQSYFLHAINQEALSRTLFPVGSYTKKEIRQIAQEQDLITFNKKDSTGICFIGERHFTTFLKEYFLTKKGPIETTDNKVIGEHDGLMYYTIGQRQGLNLGGIKGMPELPWFVIDKNVSTNTLIVAQGTDHPMLYSNGLMCAKPDWISTPPEFPLSCCVKTRYREQNIPAMLTQTADNEYCVLFQKPVRAVTPGQSVVFYENDICLGGAIIEAPIK